MYGKWPQMKLDMSLHLGWCDMDDFDFDAADEEFKEVEEDIAYESGEKVLDGEKDESPTPTLDAARERGSWENNDERDKALEEATDEFIKQHVGAYVKIKYVGGFYDGRYSQVRKPLKKVMEVAKPPRETSPGCFTMDVAYEAYYLRVVDNVVYYVEESNLADFINKYGG